eukprot:Platyproteum_vivax@DN16184_c0_g1_i1.p1
MFVYLLYPYGNAPIARRPHESPMRRDSPLPMPIKEKESPTRVRSELRGFMQAKSRGLLLAPKRESSLAPSRQYSAVSTNPKYNYLPERPFILLFGDTVIANSINVNRGWGSQLGNSYSRKADMLIRGYPGYNSRMCSKIAKRVFKSVNALVAGACTSLLFAVFCIGSVDSLSPHHPIHIDVREYCKYMQRMVENFRAIFPHTPMVLLSPPPVHPQNQKSTNGFVQAYAAALNQLKNSINTDGVVINLMQDMQRTEATQWPKYLQDDINFSESGHDFVFMLVMSAVQHLR